MKQSLKFPSDPGHLAEMRSAARKFLTSAGADELSTESLVLALDEACTNIFRHAYLGNDSRTIRMHFAIDAGTFTCVIRDYGKSCDPAKIKSRELTDFRPGGLGVCLIKNAFDSVQYDPMPRGTRLTLIKKLRVP